jgi:tRNA G46 methylase TrmB
MTFHSFCSSPDDFSSQRSHYQKGGIGSWFRRYRDQKVFLRFKKEWRVIIDLGCGEGITLEQLAGRFPDKICLGIELNKQSVEACRSYRLPVLNGNVYYLSVKTGSMDCCLMMDVIEHLDLYEETLKEINRILKPGGTLILVFPNDRNFFWSRLLCLKWKEAYHESGHVKQWNPKEMKHFLERMGFRTSYRKSIPFLFWPLSLYHIVQAEKN